MAESRAHGRLVAPSTSTPPVSLPTPCIWTINSVLTLLEDSFSPSLLDPAKESISSIKIIEGDFSWAIWNRLLISFSLSPTYLLIRSLLEIEKKVELAWVAQALAKKVFPVPGGPYRRIPFQGFRIPTKISGNLEGRIMASFKAILAPSKPATSSHLTLGFSVTMALPMAESCFSWSGFLGSSH